MGLRRYYCGSDGRLHMVHGSDNFVEVRVPALGVACLFSFMLTPTFIFVLGHDSDARPIKQIIRQPQLPLIR